MAFFQIEWKTSAIRELKRLDRSVTSRIVEVVGNLSENPFPPGRRKLEGGGNCYRIRISDYRVIYEVTTEHLLVKIVRVRHRKDVYRH